MRTRTHPQRLFVGIHLFMLLGLLLAACGSNMGNGSKSGQTAASGKTTLPPNGWSVVSGDYIPKQESIKLGPQTCPRQVREPSYWDSIVRTSREINKVESVSCANLLGDASLQAMVTVRYADSDAQLDVYTYTNLANAHPKQIFAVHGLVEGDARISHSNTLMTAEVDKSSAINADKPVKAMAQDLFREFGASIDKTTLTQTLFPGIFPDLTRYQAEADQRIVEDGRDQWKNDAVETAQAMTAKLLNWTANASDEVLSGGGPRDIDAVVRLVSPYPEGRAVIVTLSRLEGVIGNIWEVTGVTAGDLTVMSPASLATLTNPVTLKGAGSAFEGVIGRTFVFDHLYTTIGQNEVIAGGMGKTDYTSRIAYTATFKGVQEGLVAIYAYSQADNSVASAVLQKELLSADG